MESSSNDDLAPGAIEKIKILGAVLELPAKQACQYSAFNSRMRQMGWIGSAIQLVAPKRLPSAD